MCDVPESLLSDRGTNLLSYPMTDVCSLLGITKLNTTAYHPQCDGLTERFNHTLKTMIRKHVDVYGKQWDKYLHYKKYYNKVNKCSPVQFKIGGLVLIRFPQEESGKFRKLSCLWHGPY